MYGKYESLDLIKFCFLSNIYAGEGNYLVPNLVGKSGEGKTAIIHGLTDELKGEFETVNATSLGEKELSGIPYVIGDKYVQIKHSSIERVASVEKVYIDKLYSDGMLGGKLTVENDNLLYNGKIIYTSKLNKLLYNEDDIKKDIFNNIPGELKLQLIASGDINIMVLFIDEINRAIEPVHAELMTITQYNYVPGYKIPWFTQFAAAMNPDSTMTDNDDHEYNVREFDEAILGRFLMIPFELSSGEYTDYLANIKGLDSDTLIAYTMIELNETPLLMDKALDTLITKNITKRAKTNAMYAYANARKVIMNIPTLANQFSDITSTAEKFVTCHCGTGFKTKLTSMLNNMETLVTVSDICKSEPLDDVVMSKYLKSSTLTQINLINLTINHLCDPEITKEVQHLLNPSNLMKNYKTVQKDGRNTAIFDIECVPSKYLQYAKNLAKLINASKSNVKLSVNNNTRLSKNILLSALLMNLADIAQNRAMIAQLQML